MSEIVGGKLGPEASYKLELVDGKIQLSLTYAGAETSATIAVASSPRIFLDKLAAAIPGGIDDAIIKGLELALGL